jgi:hypothetical protein
MSAGIFYPFGFLPWRVREIAEDDKPITIWDGSTRFDGLPSKSQSKAVVVVGPGTEYCIPLTLQQVVEYYWSVKAVTVTVDGSNSVPGASYSGTAGSGSAPGVTLGNRTSTLRRDKKNISGEFFDLNRYDLLILDRTQQTWQGQDSQAWTNWDGEKSTESNLSDSKSSGAGSYNPDTGYSSLGGEASCNISMAYDSLPDPPNPNNILLAEDGKYWYKIPVYSITASNSWAQDARDGYSSGGNGAGILTGDIDTLPDAEFPNKSSISIPFRLYLKSQQSPIRVNIQAISYNGSGGLIPTDGGRNGQILNYDPHGATITLTPPTIEVRVTETWSFFKLT